MRNKMKLECVMDHEHHKEFEVGEINIMNICPKNNSQNDSKKKRLCS